MRLLLIHQNFPGQFRQLAPYLLKQGHDLAAICSHQRPAPMPIQLLRYTPPSKVKGLQHFGGSMWLEALQRAESVTHAVAALLAKGWQPDAVLAHSGWGETLGISELLPDVPQVIWPELWVRPEHGGHGTDPGLPQKLEQLGRHALTRVALAEAQAWVLPTRHQANSFPSEFQGSRLHVVHEGIDASVACPNPLVRYSVRDCSIDRSVPTITFVNRNLERLRGFDMFMRALPMIQRAHSQVRILIVGDNESGYAGGSPGGEPLRQVMLRELQGELDLSRIHFLGRIPHPQLMALLQASWVHVYLSYPFVMGWSLLEAMACGCCIVGSRGMPVAEVIEDGVQGLLVPMGDVELLARRVIALLNAPDLRRNLGEAARKEALSWDQSVTLPQILRVIEEAVKCR
ncbi:glycosyltransferase [Synechococcus sp. CS-197]|uniref:glycosyltransferase n=1 Tax=Synechococcus sp. CS-197 TaxID=2847985 RepID=UPI00223BD76E|nr:glycosyltransferase [Synechococcus sp. CS-197]MCT0250838.1 glycosyltransferase [Synechococcus sp. CS-197]